MYQSTYGVDAATLFSYIYGMDEASFKEYMRKQAEFNTQFGYLASAVADAEKVTCTDDEISELAPNLLTSYGYESIEELYASLKNIYGVEGKDVVAEQVKLNKAADIIYNSGVAGN